MSRLVLVKHSMPVIVPGQPPSQWRLGHEGRRRAAALADQLAGYRPALVASSPEPKALATAQIVAGRWGWPLVIEWGLHEHERDGYPFGPTEQFEADVARFFDRPDELVMGHESAAQAGERFARAITALRGRAGAGDLLVVAHGTVIALFVAAAAGAAPFPLWQRLGLPSYVALALPGLELETIVESI